MSLDTEFITTPDSPKLKRLCTQLRSLEVGSDFPIEQMELIRSSGVYRWFIPESLGGMGWSNPEVANGYVQLASACLTTTFIVTQRVAAIRRICATENVALREQLLPGLLDGNRPATVGISHLTTSRRHVRKPVLNATPAAGGYVLQGFSPWVTGASAAATIVVGAETEDRGQVLFAIPSDIPGMKVEPGFDLVALTASQTGAVRFDEVQVDERYLLGGPTENVLALTKTPSTGSLQTSALAIGLTQAAIDFIRSESENRPDLVPMLDALDDQLSTILARLFKLAAGATICTNEDLRKEANSLVLRATQSALVAAKGTGFVKGHPVGRWCQEALFFLVWSCPQSVLNANLCELAGIES